MKRDVMDAIADLVFAVVIMFGGSAVLAMILWAVSGCTPTVKQSLTVEQRIAERVQRDEAKEPKP